MYKPHNKKRGHHILFVRWLRLTTALQVDEQSDTHVAITDCPEVCYEGMDSPLAHNGTLFQYTRGINSALPLTCNWLWLFQSANRQSIDDAFHYVDSLLKIHPKAKLRHENGCKLSEYMWNHQIFMRFFSIWHGYFSAETGYWVNSSLKIQYMVSH